MKKKTLWITIFSILFIALISFTIYAAFSMTQSYDAEINHHQITLTDGQLSGAIKDDLEFNAPGDRISITYSLNNSGSTKPYNFYFTLNATGDDTKYLDAIFVYQDGTYCGVLSNYLAANLPDPLPLNKTIFKGETLNDATTITYELHNSLDSVPTNPVSVKLKCNLETTNAQKFIYVSNIDEFSKAIDDVNSEEGKTIVLTNSINTASEYSISKNCSIDLAGNTISLGANVDINADVRLYDSRINGAVTGSKFVLNTEQSFMQLDYQLSSANIDITNYNQMRLFECLFSNSDSVLNKFTHFVNGTIYNLYGNYSVYGTDFYTYDGITFTDNSAVVNENGIGSITCTVGENIGTIEYKVYLDDSNAILENIKLNELKHIVAFDSTTTTYDVLHDIYLPTAIKRHNATISWWSSNEDVLSNDGRTQEEQGFVTLIATLKINNEIFTETFLIHIAKQDDMMRLQYLISMIGYIDLNHVGLCTAGNEHESEHILPTKIDDVPTGVTDEKELRQYYKYFTEGENLGITDIKYEIDTSYYYLGIQGGNTVYLNQVTFQKYAKVRITAKFDGGSEEGETGHVNVKISLKNDTTLQKKVFDYIQAELDSVDVLKNILNTRASEGVDNERGDFVLPTEYMNVGITYEISQTGAHANVVSNITADGNIILDLNKLRLNETRVPLTVTLTIDGEKASSKDLYFNVPPALTVDNFGFAGHMDIFNTLQLQTLQHSEEHYIDKDGTKLYFYNITSIDDINGLNNYNTSIRKQYILMDDIVKCKELIFELGNTSVILDKYELTHLQKLFDWALDTTGTKNREGVPVDSNLSWIESDNTSDITDGEILVILNYCERFIGFENEWIKDVHVGDNIISADDIIELMATLVEQDFINLLNWAQGDTTDVVPTVTTCIIPDYIKSNISDGLPSISYLEEEAIIYYIENNTNANIASTKLLSAWLKAIKKTDDIYLNDDDTAVFTSVPEMETDYIFDKILAWETTTAIGDLRDYLNNGEIAMFFDDTENFSNYSATGGLSGRKYYATSDNEWEIIKKYFLKAYNVVLTDYFTGNDYDGNQSDSTFTSPYQTGNTPVSVTVCEVGTWLVGNVGLTSAFRSALKNLADQLMKQNMNNLESLFTWATNTSKGDAPVTISPTATIDNQSISLSSRKSDGRETVSIFEYTAIEMYYDSNIGNYQLTDVNGKVLQMQPLLKNCLKRYYITDRLIMTFGDDSLSASDKKSLYSDMTDGIFEDFDEMIALATTTQSYGPIAVEGQDEIWYDNLYTISETEYNKFLTEFSDKSLFVNKFKEVVKFEADGVLDRKLDNPTILIDFVKQYLDYASDLKFKYALVGKLDDDIKVLEALRYYENLEVLSVNGNSVSSIFVDSANSNKLFSLVSNNNKKLVELDYTYCAVSDIAPIVNLVNLRTINFRGNKTLINVHYILEINNGQIEMINIFDTGVDFTYVEPDFIKMFIDYQDSHDEEPKYYYDEKGVETLFEITGITSADYDAMDLCYLLAPLEVIGGNRLQLPKSVFVLNGDTVLEVAITWNKVSGAVSMPTLSSDDRGYYVVTNGGEITISATISYNGGTYTRYFTFTNN